MVRGREKFEKFKPLIKLVVRGCSIFPIQSRIIVFESCRMVKGYKGLVFRYVLLKSIAKEIGDNVSIHPGVYLLNPKNISIGNNVSLHPMCYIEAFGEVEIGNNISIAHGVTIMSTGHYFDKIDISINNQGAFCKKVKINDNVWIGAKATILAGNTIGSGSIIGAGAVVTKDVNVNTVVGGIPARIIKERV